MRWFTNTRFRGDRKAWETSSQGGAVAVGEPRATVHHTVDELRKLGMVGLYEVRVGRAALPDPANPRNEGERSAFSGLLP